MIRGLGLCLVYGLTLSAGACVVHAADADGDYLSIFNRLREAEQTEARGAREEACTAFRALQVQLMQFQRAYPSWHPEIVAFRLRTLDAGVRRLCAAPGPDADVASSSPAADGSDLKPLETEDLLRLRIRQLEADREELLGKLREALAAQPAVVDAPEVVRAEDRIRELEKEVALLRFAALASQSSEGEGEGVLREISTDAESPLQAELRALKEELALERQKVAALEAAAGNLKAELPETSESPAPPLPPQETASASQSAAPEDPSDVLERARGWMKAGEVDKTIFLLGREAQEPETSAEILSLLGNAFLSKGLHDPAEAVVRRALSVDASCAEAHYLMARLCLQRSPPARGLARWHYHEARRHGWAADPELEDL